MEEDLKIKFYSLGSEKIEFLKNSFENEFDSSKVFVSSSNFDFALSKVIEKDIMGLNAKISDIIGEVKTRFDDLDDASSLDSSFDANDIDKILTCLDTDLKRLNILKSNNKVGVFSSDKKRKKEKLKLIDILADYINKSKVDITSMNNEYNKLCERKEGLLVQDEEEVVKDDNPLERTVNFYVKKQEES